MTTVLIIKHTEKTGRRAYPISSDEADDLVDKKKAKKVNNALYEMLPAENAEEKRNDNEAKKEAISEVEKDTAPSYGTKVIQPKHDTSKRRNRRR